MKPTIQIIILSIMAIFIAYIAQIPYNPIRHTTQYDDNIITVKEEYIGESLENPLPDRHVPEVIEDYINQRQQNIIVDEKAKVVAEIPKDISIIEFAYKEQVVDEGVETSDLAPQTSFPKINEYARKALVNIFCTTKSGGSFNPITGSGVIIDERGIILTNAHVAQYFLLKDYLVKDFIDCVVRTGSPAVSQYKAEPIFISPSWVKTNANGIIQQSPKGTGEDDYALLLITERIDGDVLPRSFNFIPPLYNSSNIEVGNNVLLAAYPAGFLSGISISRDLYINSAVTQIIEAFTFKDGTLDLFSIGGSVVAQQGSSGGAVVDTDNKLLGIIVTSSVADNTANRDLRAITIAHINRSFVKDTGFDLQTLFSSNIEAEANAFNENIAPGLTQLLVNELEK